MKTLLKNATIINPDNIFVSDVLFDEKILEIAEEVKLKDDYLVFDATGKSLMPGLIDPHVHFRTPGLTYKEDFYSGTCAAAAGGVTTVFDMPNTIPPTLSKEILNEKRKICGDLAVVNFGLFFGASEKNLEEIKKVKNIPAVKMFLNDTTGNLKMDDESKWAEIFQNTRKVSMHAEGDTFAKAVEVWKSVGAPCEIHLVHTVLRQEVDLIRELKKDPRYAAKITCEVCPHHLLYNKKDLLERPFLRMKPELATADDMLALWEGVEDDIIDFFATDHAPHKPNEKEANPPAFGVPGVQELFLILYTEFQKRGWSFEKLVRMTSTRTAEAYHLADQKGRIGVGYDADMVLFDPNEETMIFSEWNKHSQAEWTAYDGYEATMQVEKTFVRGVMVFDGENVVVEPGFGEEITFQ